MKFKVGDRVKVVTEEYGNQKYIGKNGVIVEFNQGHSYPYLVKFNNLEDREFCDAELAGYISGYLENPKEARFGVNWMEDEDPTEFFKTRAAAEKRIEELLEDEAVKKDSIYLFEITNVQHVERPVTYRLVNIVRKALGRPRKDKS